MTGTPITQLDLSGFTPLDEFAWQDGNGIVLSLHYFDIPPDLPAPLESVPQLQAALARHTAAAGAGLFDCAVEPVDGVPAVRQLVKLTHPQGHGQVFIASCTVPRATCSTVLKLQAPERGMTGFREAIIMDRLGPAEFFRPSPYAPDLTGGLPAHRADEPQYDAEFPQHPLTLARQLMHRLLPTVRLDPRFKAEPAFA
ncbi:hypothetical protein [Dactylosporangium matsuzakiense]|nr:hypothetical protein [Dactylosporangium matsuzakiense]UWZ41474.1 hypothetical protein Dmats_27840 [Dactylosporangium matsuzakiense]